jgi:hypothetical protein
MLEHFSFFGFSPLYVMQVALTIWMLVDCHRRGVEPYWFWIILFFQPLGAWAYFFLYKVKDFTEVGWLSNLFSRGPSLEELRHRAEQSPTVANRLDLAERLVKIEEYADAQPHLASVLDREPEHCRALFLLAHCHRNLGHAEQAVPLLQKLVARQPNWGDYEARRTLIAVCREVGDSTAALGHCRELARLAPSLQHRCLLGEQLLDMGETGEARKVVEDGLDEYRYLTGPSRRRDRRWVGTAKQLVKEAAATNNTHQR